MKFRAFSFRKMISSFRFACQGFQSLFLEEPNARIHMIAVLVVVLGGWYFQIRIWEWVSVILCFALVISMELINTTIENIADFISPEHDKRIGKMKDQAAAAVLFSAMLALIVGLIIFVPRIGALF